MKILHLLLALLIGLGLGLAYSWYISPVTYVDASPAILRSDFKDQFRDVIAASYVSTHDLARARARLSLLGDADVIAELSAQAQRMVAAGESFERIQPLARLAADLQQGFVSSPATSTEFAVISTPFAADTPIVASPTAAPDVTETQSTAETVVPTLATATTSTVTPTTSFAQTALIPLASSTFAPRPTFTPIPPPSAPFTLASQESICEPGSQAGLMQFILMDQRRIQLAGIEIVITSNQGEDHSFTGFKPELGNGYADFVMQAETVYSVRVVDGGILIPDIIAPICTDPNNGKYTGGVLLVFQQK
ncbi:MAG: hypothetical protein HY864_18030 [Chloroflexi bacterium]|nr:hypothetical protein [Chloroflexota bacterium]